MGLHRVARRRHDLCRGVGGQAAQPVFLRQRQALFGTISLVILIVIGQLKLREELIDGVDPVRAVTALRALIPPSFGL